MARRTIAVSCTVLLFSALIIGRMSARAEVFLPTIVVPDLEMTGDLSDTARAEEWRERAALATRTLRKALAEQHLYDVRDLAPAADIVARDRMRVSVHECKACLMELAQRVGAKRILTTWVFRMSQLVLSLHAEVRDADSGHLIWQRALSFRGDSDRTWLKAVDYLVNEIRRQPVEQR